MERRRDRRWTGLATVGLAVSAVLAAPCVATAHPRILRVGSYHGIPGQFSSIQRAVRAAHKGDWVLVGPGDYHERGYKGETEPAGVLITTPHLHLRGMARNRTIVDGTKASASGACSSKKRDQIVKRDGRNGVVAFKVNGVSIQNLTVCNYLTGPKGGEGNEIWWNGGDGSGKIGMRSYEGDHLTATSSYSKGVDNPRGEYGIFVSNSRGPGVINRTYASNMGDAAYYIGACPNCHAVLRHAHGEDSALGYSGTNSGGHLIVTRSLFDHNKSGFTSNSQNNDDAPSPQNGLCPNQAKAPPGGRICNVLEHNVFRNNNNPNVPGAGSGLAGASPVGTGVVLAGTEFVKLRHNKVRRNGSWGMLVADLPDQETPPPIAHCEGGIYVSPPPSPEPTCYYQAFGNQLKHNSFAHNGGFANPTNGDIGVATIAHDPGNCVHGNADPDGLSTFPVGLQSNPAFYPCGQANAGDFDALAAEAVCASQLVGPCPGLPGATYPRPTKVVLHLPHHQPSMRNPCKDVPSNPWCPARRG